MITIILINLAKFFISPCFSQIFSFDNSTSEKSGDRQIIHIGLVEFGKMDEKQRFRRYRKYLFEAGAIDKYDGKSKNVIDKKIVLSLF